MPGKQVPAGIEFGPGCPIADCDEEDDAAEDDDPAEDAEGGGE